MTSLQSVSSLPSGSIPRMNDSSSNILEISILGQTVILHQNVSSANHGHVVWDASIILAKYFETSPSALPRKSLTQKTVLELGAGCGLGGLFCGMLGAKLVTLTDKASVLPILQKNISANQAMIPNIQNVQVSEYLWGTEDIVGCNLLEEGYDYILAADCIYDIEAVEPFIASLNLVSNAKSNIYIANEERDIIVMERFQQRLIEEGYSVKRIGKNKLHKDFRHDLVHILHCKRLKKNVGKDKENEKKELDLQNPQSEEPGNIGNDAYVNQKMASIKFCDLEKKEEGIQSDSTDSVIDKENSESHQNKSICEEESRGLEDKRKEEK